MRAKKRFGGKKLATNPLHDAAHRGDLEQARAIFKADPDLTYSKDKFGRTPLHCAANMGWQHVVEFLLSRNRKADVNAKTDEGWTPFRLASFRVDWDLLELLRQHGGQK